MKKNKSYRTFISSFQFSQLINISFRIRRKHIDHFIQFFSLQTRHPEHRSFSQRHRKIGRAWTESNSLDSQSLWTCAAPAPFSKEKIFPSLEGARGQAEARTCAIQGDKTAVLPRFSSQNPILALKVERKTDMIWLLFCNCFSHYPMHTHRKRLSENLTIFCFISTSTSLRFIPILTSFDQFCGRRQEGKGKEMREMGAGNRWKEAVIPTQNSGSQNESWDKHGCPPPPGLMLTALALPFSTLPEANHLISRNLLTTSHLQPSPSDS